MHNTEMNEAGKTQLASLQNALAAAIDSIDWAKVADAIHEYKAGFPEQLRMLALHGWFISAWHTPMRAIYPLADSFRSGKIEEAHQTLCWHFKQVLPEIEDDLIARFPERAVIIRKAFGAHRTGDFELSIPVFLAQADGISRDVIAKEMPRFSVYSKQDKFRNVTQNFIDQFVKEELVTRDILQVALIEMPLNVSEGSSMLKGEVLNRNAILHGMNTTYATSLNSYRAISWLQFVSYFQTMKGFG